VTERRRILEETGRLIEAIGQPDFPLALRRAIDALAPIDSYLVLAYHQRRTPVILHNGLKPAERPVFFETYLSGAYLLSPFYQACMAGTEPGFHLISEIAPDGFAESEFCKAYYAPAGRAAPSSSPSGGLKSMTLSPRKRRGCCGASFRW
jgi:hypothetical protein